MLLLSCLLVLSVSAVFPFYMVAPRNLSKIAPSLQSLQVRGDRAIASSARLCARHRNIVREKTGEDIDH